MDATNRSKKARIAHLSGPTATIQNTPPLVTSNKARAKHGLPLLTDVDGGTVRHDALRLQRLAAPAKVYVERFSAHPLEVRRERALRAARMDRSVQMARSEKNDAATATSRSTRSS